MVDTVQTNLDEQLSQHLLEEIRGGSIFLFSMPNHVLREDGSQYFSANHPH